MKNELQKYCSQERTFLSIVVLETHRCEELWQTSNTRKQSIIFVYCQNTINVIRERLLTFIRGIINYDHPKNAIA